MEVQVIKYCLRIDLGLAIDQRVGPLGKVQLAAHHAVTQRADGKPVYRQKHPAAVVAEAHRKITAHLLCRVRPVLVKGRLPGGQRTVCAGGVGQTGVVEPGLPDGQ